MPADDTRSAILDAAEALIGEVGFAAASMREITRRAAVNLASVNYHFGSKEDLAKALLLRRIAPVNAERLRRLDALEAAAAPPEVLAVVEAFVEPPMLLVGNCGVDGPCAMIGRLIAEQPAFLRAFMAEQFRDVVQRFARALVGAVPGLSPAEALWRLHFMVGAMSHVMQHGPFLHSVFGCGANAGDAAGDYDHAAAARRLATFCAAGMGTAVELGSTATMGEN